MHIIRKITLILSLVFFLWGAGYLYFALRALSLAPNSPDQSTNAIVVLTGGQGRIETGLALFVEGRAANLFITGVHPHVRRSEIRALWKGAHPLPNCCIMLGYEARTTQQNAQETKDWLATQGHKSMRLVTGNFHMARALHEFRRAMPDIKIIPHPITQPDFKPEEPRYWVMAFGEYHKTLFRRVILHFEAYLPESLINLQLNPKDNLEPAAQ